MTPIFDVGTPGHLKGALLGCPGPGTLHERICSKADHGRVFWSFGLGAGLVSTAHGKGSTSSVR